MTVNDFDPKEPHYGRLSTGTQDAALRRYLKLDIEPADIAQRALSETLLRLDAYDQFQAAQREKVTRMATLDDITGGWNRSYLIQALEMETQRASRHRYPLSVYFMDLDGFKHVNDSQGHLTGNAVLRKAYDAIQRNIRPYDIAGRFGGDEFMVIAPGLAEQAAKSRALAIGEAIHASCSTPNYQVTASIGIASAMPEEGVYHPETLLAFADQAMYQAKNDRKQGTVGAMEGIQYVVVLREPKDVM